MEEKKFREYKSRHRNKVKTFTYKETMHTTMELYGRQWAKVNDFRPSDNDWLVITTDLGELWMNNLDGVMHIVTKRGGILKTYI